jgi:hypothetical protein
MSAKSAPPIRGISGIIWYFSRKRDAGFNMSAILPDIFPVRGTSFNVSSFSLGVTSISGVVIVPPSAFFLTLIGILLLF